MTKYRRGLPQLRGHLFLTDDGIETNLMFHDAFDLPFFAAFHLLRNREGRDAIVRYYERFIAIARAHDLGFILESPTWRASSDWGEKLGYTRDGIGVINLLNLRARHESAHTPIVISGCVGPRGDGYDPGIDGYDPGIMVTTEEATVYHAHQIGVFAEAGADMVTGMTITNATEAIGIVRAARTAGMPVVISFTLETDGRLPTGQPLSEAIREVDTATEGAPAYYMLNCAHPTHFEHALYMAYAPMHRGATTPNSTRHPTWTMATLPNSGRNTPRSAGVSLESTCSAAVAARTIAISSGSATRAKRRPRERSHHAGF